MKRLGEQQKTGNKQATGRRPRNFSLNTKKLPEDKVYVTKSMTSVEEAVEAKMAEVEPKFLGIKMVKYGTEGKRNVWVPCYYMVYDFDITPTFFNKAGAFNRNGTLGVVYDANQMHASHYDVLTDGDIPMQEKRVDDMEGVILPDNGTLEEIIKSAEYSIRRQVLFKAYKTMDSNLNQLKLVKFYRQACELELSFKDRTYIKYAYLDDYGVKNERARGLKTRLNPTI